MSFAALKALAQFKKSSSSSISSIRSNSAPASFLFTSPSVPKLFKKFDARYASACATCSKANTYSLWYSTICPLPMPRLSFRTLAIQCTTWPIKSISKERATCVVPHPGASYATCGPSGTNVL